MDSSINITGTWNIKRGNSEAKQHKGELVIDSVNPAGKIKGPFFIMKLRKGISIVLLERFVL